jgi:hypothetical protein
MDIAERVLPDLPGLRVGLEFGRGCASVRQREYGQEFLELLPAFSHDALPNRRHLLPVLCALALEPGRAGPLHIIVGTVPHIASKPGISVAAVGAARHLTLNSSILKHQEFFCHLILVTRCLVLFPRLLIIFTTHKITLTKSSNVTFQKIMVNVFKFFIYVLLDRRR